MEILCKNEKSSKELDLMKGKNNLGPGLTVCIDRWDLQVILLLLGAENILTDATLPSF